MPVYLNWRLKGPQGTSTVKMKRVILYPVPYITTRTKTLEMKFYFLFNKISLGYCFVAKIGKIRYAFLQICINLIQSSLKSRLSNFSPKEPEKNFYKDIEKTEWMTLKNL